MSDVDTATVERLVNGDLAARDRPPLPAEVLGANAALLLAAIARSLPPEIAPQSRYQIAIDLTRAAMSGPLAEMLTRGG